jgi:hypothetical protein
MNLKHLCQATLLLALAALLNSCGAVGFDEGEDYGNLLDSPDGLVLTQDEHEIGWAHTDCTMCHNLDNIHLTNRTDIEIDIDAIREEAIAGGIAVCADCHGTNGVP